MIITLLHPRATLEHLGMIPVWFDASPQTMPFKDVVKHHYVGGWFSSKGGELDTSNGEFQYPGDPLQKPFAAIIRANAGEIIFAYDHAFFAVVTIDERGREASMKGLDMPSDMTWDMARLD